MLHSIQQRLVLLVCVSGALITSLAVFSTYLLEAASNTTTVLLIATALALVALTGFSWLLLHPVLQGLEQLAASVINVDRNGEPIRQRVALKELDDIARALSQFNRNRQDIMAQVSSVMQGLEKGELRFNALTNSHFSATPPEDERMVKAVQTGLTHLEALIAELKHFIQRLYSEVQDTGTDPTMSSAWHDHPLLGPALERMANGHWRLLKTVHDMTMVVEKSSITLADMSWQANTINREMKALAVKGAQISASSQSLAHNSNRVSSDAASVAQLALQARENSQYGQIELNNTIDAMRQMGARTQSVSSSITGLQTSSQKIEDIVQLIRDIANKINLLSLNAAIEAARAGEHGKGFAVVSDEVRKLAEKTFEATQEIDASVGGITSQTEQAVNSMNELAGEVQSNVQRIEQVGQRLSGILDSSSVLSEQMDGIVQASSQSAEEVSKISSYLGEIQDELASFGVRIDAQESQTQALTELSEGFYEKLVELNLQTLHRRMFKVARDAADAVQTTFEQAISQGVISQSDLLSLVHEPVPHTNPQKFTSRFDSFTDKVLPLIQEKALKNHPELVFAICTNKRGYVPTHNDKFAKPLTGRYEVDLVNSRSKRIFNDRTGSRCGSHTQKVLLQTYKRDTGEIMHDLSVPIMVGGTHWGGFRMGYKAD